jgi:hypothetical protein
MLGSAGVYKLAHQFMSIFASILAAAIFSYAPYHFFEVWIQGNLAQFVAVSFMPWLLWGLLRAANNPVPNNILAIALPFTGIALSHQPSLLVIGIAAIPVTILFPFKSFYQQDAAGAILKRYKILAISFMLGAGLSAFFLLPMTLELRNVKSVVNPESFSTNFLPINTLFALPYPTDLTDKFVTMPKTLGSIGVVLCLAGFIGLLRDRKYLWTTLIGGGLTLSIFMTNESSTTFWRLLPQFDKLLFPERFLHLAGIFVALLGGASINLLPTRLHKIGLLIGVIVIVFQAMPLIVPRQDFKSWENITARDEILMEINQSTWGTTSFDEFEPKWGNSVAYSAPTDVESYKEHPLEIHIDQTLLSGLQYEQIDDATIEVRLNQPRAVSFQQYYFPGWNATIDEKSTRVYPEDTLGLLTLDLPEGVHTIRLKYTGTNVQKFGVWITVISIVSVIYIQLKTYPRKKIAQVLPNPTISTSFAVILTFAVMAIAVLTAFYIIPDTTLFRYESPPDKPYYMKTPTYETFENGFELLGYTLGDNKISADNPLDLTLFWSTTETNIRPLRTIVQLVDLPVTQAWASSEPLRFIKDDAVGLTSQEFASNIYRLELFENAPPYIGQISIQLVDKETNLRLNLSDGSDRILLPDLIQIEAPNPQIHDLFDYNFSNSITLQCASIYQTGNQWDIDLYWRIKKPFEDDVVVFVHGLNTEGMLIEQNDGQPFNGLYPPQYWRPNKLLLDHHTLPFNEQITNIAIGLYTLPDIERLQLVSNEQTIPDGRIILPIEIEKEDCGAQNQ